MKLFLFDNDEVMPAVGVIEPQQPGELSRLDFGKPAGGLGCYLNYDAYDPVPCTDKQKELIEERGYIVPDGLTRNEANLVIDRIRGKDTLQSPDWQIVELANGFKLKMSAYVGAKALMHMIVRHGSLRDQAALYCYGVLQYLRGASFGNMLSDSNCQVFYGFADAVEGDQSLRRSLDSRQISEYTEPKTSVKIYNAAVEHLKAGLVI